MPPNIGSNIVLHDVVKLKTVLNVKCHFTNTAMETRLPPWPLLLLSHSCQNPLLDRKTMCDLVLLVFFPVPWIFSGKWLPAWSRVEHSTDLLWRPLGSSRRRRNTRATEKLLDKLPSENSLQHWWPCSLLVQDITVQYGQFNYCIKLYGR